jgi:hypothetical protein
MTLAFFVWFAIQQTVPITGISAHPNGSVRITYSDGKVVEAPKEKDQSACLDLAVADDKQTAGWLVAYPNPTASYPIPTTLIIYRSGKVLRRIDSGFMFSSWRFMNGGKQVAFHTNTVHGDLAPYYELRDIDANKVIDKWEGPQSERAPNWVKQTFR